MVKINQQELDLEATPTEWPQIDQYKKAIKPYQELWQLVADWERSKYHWTMSVLRSLVPDEVEKEHKTMRSVCARLDAIFSRDKATQKPGGLAKLILREIEEFKTKLPIIRALCTEGLQARHIEQIKIVLDTDNYTGEESLSSFSIEPWHKDKLEDIADTASKEFSNEKILKNMFKDWEPLEFTPMDCKGTYKLGGDSIELIQQTLDDHLIKT
jgi:dynein heavy chain